MSGFTAGFGRWLGSAEVFDGAGHFAGNAMDLRHVQNLGGGRTRIDVTFVGPFKASGHYDIQDFGDYRQYLGPINVGYAEVLAETLVDATAYWASIGMTQRFFLMVLPEHNMQLSLAQMLRGDQLMYSVVGENQRVDDQNAQPHLISGAACDLESDPSAGRGDILLHRAGTWQGTLSVLNGARQCLGTSDYDETLSLRDGMLTAHITNNATADQLTAHVCELRFTTNHRQAWTPAGSVVGSYNLCGGRALSGHFNHVESGWRVWRREVVCHSGTQKAVLHHWYKGQERLAVHYGLLDFVAAS